MEFTWEYLATIAGAGAAVTLIVQIAKKIIGKEVNKWYLRALTYVIGVGVLIAAKCFTGVLTLESGLMCALEGIAVYFAATGEYHSVIKEITNK